jgi:NADH dehydrogenase
MQQHVVVIGAGFAGLYAVRELLDHPEVRLTLVDRHNYHLFVPLLYQVAIAGLEAPEIAHPARDVLRGHPRASFVLGEVKRVDRENRTIWVDDEPLPYDYLLVACGSQTNTLGVDGVVEHSTGLKSVADAMSIRDRILSACEESAHSTDPDRVRAMLTFAIVGGGPTGVELAGALAEIRKKIIPRYYPEIDPRLYRVIVIDSSPRIVSMLSEASSAYAEKTLSELGVELRLNTRISEVTPQGVRTEDGDFIDAFNTIWAAGVVGSPIEGLSEPGTGNRVPTTPLLTLEDDPRVYVAGDVNGYVPPKQEKPYPQVAPMATQQGEHAAKNIVRAIRGQKLKRFRYRDRGSMVTVGRGRAVAERGPIKITGFPAWFAWLAIHLLKLSGGRNRALVLISWIHGYLTYDFAVRVLHQRQRFPKKKGTSENKEFEQVEE